MTGLSKRRFPIWPLGITLLTVLVDRVSKYFAVRFLGPDAPAHTISILEPIFRLSYLENTGISFGKLQEYGTFITLFGFVATVGLLVGYRYLLTPARWANVSVGLILGGAVGNQIDRVANALRYGLSRAYVVDFMDLRFWAVFNVADAAITIGGVIYGAYLLFYRSRTPAGEQPEGKAWPKPEEPPPAA